MHKIQLLVVLLVIACLSFPAQLQAESSSDLISDYLHTGQSSQKFCPDVLGHFHMTDQFAAESGFLQIPQDNRAIALYPNWPQSMSGRNQRGGVYCNLDGDPELEIIYTAGNRIYAWNIDGTSVAGWPQTLIYYCNGAPACGDVDGDGIEEIVVSTRTSGTGNSGYLHVFELDGTDTPGFPIALNGGGTKTPALGNIDGDAALEIVIEERAWPAGYVCVYKGDATVCPGWPQELDYVPGSAAAVGDITGDGIAEIVAESYNSVYAFDALGNVLPGFPFTPGNERVFSYSSPVLADLDNDGRREIICGDHSLAMGNGQVHVLCYDGTNLPGWPQSTNQWIYGPPSVGDIDGDGSPDVAIGDQVLSGEPTDYVYAWDAAGNNLPGFPIGPIWAINSQIILADLDGDNEVELMFDDNTSLNQYLGYNHDGTPMDGWPLILQGSTFMTNPFVVDINGDNELDISGTGYVEPSTHVHLWDANVPVEAEKNFLTILQYGPHHNGVYDPIDYAAVELDYPIAGELICTPNPCLGQTTISFSGVVADPTSGLLDQGVTVSIIGSDGRIVKTLNSNNGTVFWRGLDNGGRPVASGSYWCISRLGKQTYTRRVLLTR